MRCFVKILNGDDASPAFIVKLFLQNLVYAKRAQLHQTKPEFVKENQYQLLPRHLGAYTHKASLHNNNKTINIFFSHKLGCDQFAMETNKSWGVEV